MFFFLLLGEKKSPLSEEWAWDKRTKGDDYFLARIASFAALAT